MMMLRLAQDVSVGISASSLHFARILLGVWERRGGGGVGGSGCEDAVYRPSKNTLLSGGCRRAGRFAILIVLFLILLFYYYFFNFYRC